ncbi:zf-TFIIB domain-containing protein [Blastococcus haudaquaticus]|uniref:Transcription factor zinc-finger domain-containing protein n=1 Tax=Blastococcus haudaquaticus TaxID=1938745 RepID=A0A286GRW2_9ACTN|nr:zf-TFIIB domain-containing protein [Blastococcus haudaquaticus]SOD98307.1 hypothetical protein SAMN06272739_1833 [Blastococcus haudaquaticus]
MELTCPKCHGTMRTYERNGVHVDQCADCRGIFLDRGELDRLIDAENAWHGAPAAAAPQRPDAQQHSDDERRHSEHYSGSPAGHSAAGAGAGLSGVVGEVLRQVQGSKQSSSHSGYGHRRKKESFLGDLFG